jgi:Predicted methylated DNA-protein cysteine methyltransferase
MNQTIPASLLELIYLVIEQIPSGQVSTYGEIAQIVGRGSDGRMVGKALASLPKEHQHKVPWQRVINREGVISTGSARQRELLLAEGVPFDAQGRVILARCRWRGPSPKWAAEHMVQTLAEREEGEQLSLF